MTTNTVVFLAALAALAAAPAVNVAMWLIVPPPFITPERQRRMTFSVWVLAVLVPLALVAMLLEAGL